jgi:hypothetical protein
LIFDVNECVCSAKVDTYVAREESKKIIKHRILEKMVVGFYKKTLGTGLFKRGLRPAFLKHPLTLEGASLRVKA